jgi:hypothetical protein
VYRLLDEYFEEYQGRSLSIILPMIHIKGYKFNRDAGDEGDRKRFKFFIPLTLS